MTVLRTAYVNVLPKTDNFDGDLRKRLRRIDASKDGERIGSSFGLRFTSRVAAILPGGISAAVTAGGPQVTGALVGVAAAAAASAAPILGAGLSAGLLLGVGGGVLAAGIFAASKSPAVQAAFKSFGDRAKAAFADFGKPFEGPLIRAAKTFADALERMAPTLNAMGKSMAPIVDLLAPALASMAEKSLPGIRKAMEASKPLFEAVAEMAPELGVAMSKFFEAVAKGGPGAAQFLKDTLNFLIFIIPKIGELLRWLSDRFLTWRTGVVRVVGAVRFAWNALTGWFTGVILPSLSKALAQLTGAFQRMRNLVVGANNAVRTAIFTGYMFLRNNVFSPLAALVTKTIPGAFSRGVSAIGSAWNRLKELAKAPVRFVVDTVINSAIIGTFNKVSGFFGGPKVPKVSLPKGFGDGLGQRLRKGEGDGLGEVLNFVRGPGRYIKGKVSGAIGRIGGGPYGQMLKGMSGKLSASLIEKAKSMVGLGEFAGKAGKSAGVSGLQGGIAGALATLRSVFGGVKLISGFRAGSQTLTGNTSYHASGRAIDIPPVRPWAEFLRATFGPRLKELITPWQDLNLLNGRPHTYTGAVWNQHNFAGGNAHIHAAMDDGGTRWLRPGLNVIPNGTGRLERIDGPNAGGAPVHFHFHGPVSSKQGAQEMVLEAYNQLKRERRLA